MKPRLLPEAERDLEIGADFYESQAPGLGTYFNDCLASDIEFLKLYAGIHEQYRGFHRSLQTVSLCDLLSHRRRLDQHIRNTRLPTRSKDDQRITGKTPLTLLDQ